MHWETVQTQRASGSVLIPFSHVRCLESRENCKFLEGATKSIQVGKCHASKDQVLANCVNQLADARTKRRKLKVTEGDPFPEAVDAPAHQISFPG